MSAKNTEKSTENTFQSNKHFPEELNFAQSRFSVDVLAWSQKKDQHTIAWFDFHLHKWQFLCREFQGPFVWRYLNDETDKPLKNVNNRYKNKPGNDL